MARRTAEERAVGTMTRGGSTRCATGGGVRRWSLRALVRLGAVAALAVIAAGAGSCGLMERVTRQPEPRRAPLFTTEPDVRVRVVKNATTVTISGAPTLVVRTRGPGAAMGATDSAPSPLTLTADAAGIALRDGAGKERRFEPGQDLEVMASTGGASASLRVNSATYPGVVLVLGQWGGSATGSAAFDVVADMPIEAYIPGVLTHELFRDWPRQTYEAQAVAARTYAVHERGRARREGRAWDLEATTADQVFGGLTKLRLPMDATRATTGMILTWRGEPLRAYYSSQCGGRAGSAAAVWSTAERFEFNEAEPIQGKPRTHYCQRSSRYRWEVTRTDDDVNKRLRAYGRMRSLELQNVTKVRRIEVDERNDAERPNTYRVTDDRGREYIVRAEDLRAALNHQVQGLPNVVRDKDEVLSGDFEAEIWANTVRFRGRGWGHGVGLCQWCAKGMAESGMDWASMLREFYPEAEVVKAW